MQSLCMFNEHLKNKWNEIKNSEKTLLDLINSTELAYKMTAKLEIKYPSAWNENLMAGWTWYYSFMTRHPEFVLRTPEQFSLNRVRAFCKENVMAFYGNLEKVLLPDHGPFAIWNMDETGFSTVPTKIGKVISMRGLKKVGFMTSQEEGTISGQCCG